MRSHTATSETRWITAILALLYLCFVVYGSLVPLRFVAMPLDMAFAAFRNIPFLNLGVDSRADWVANLLLFIPLAFLCNHLVTSGTPGSGRYLVSLTVLLATIGLAFAIEFTQLFFPQRTVSQNDIWAESLGSLIGIACQLRFRSMFDTWLLAVRQHESRLSRLMRALNVYLAILFAFSVLPLDLTLSPVELYHKWSEGRVLLIPFSGLKGGVAAKIYETLTDLLIWVPAGLLWSLNAKRPTWRIAVQGLMAAFAIELAQLFVYSRVTDATDILLAGVGTAIGAIVARNARHLLPSGALPPAFWSSVWALWAALVLAVFWFPYDFDASQITLSRAYGNLSRPLLANYYFGSEYHATNELLRKIALFLPGGVFWVKALSGSKTQRRTGSIVGAIVLLVIALLVETGQLFLPRKYADLTDVLIMTAGGMLGVLITSWVLSGREMASDAEAEIVHDAAAIPPATSRKHLPCVRFSNPYVIAFLALTLLIGTITRLPFVPYNLRELVAPGALGVLSIVGLSLCILWQIVGHGIFLRRCDSRYGQMIFLPLWLLAHGSVGWLLLRPSVPLESLHDILGAPVLNWVWETELIARFLALDAVVALPLLGATLLVAVAGKRSRPEALISWLAWSLTLAWPLHSVVVANAATDNLTELMRDGGSFAASMLIAGGLFSFFLAGSVVSYGLTYRYRTMLAPLSAFAALLVSAAGFWFGTEQVIVKYGKVFSAWQFLLSTDRNHYVSGFSLLARFLIGYGVALSGYIIIHMLLWKTKASDLKPIQPIL